VSFRGLQHSSWKGFGSVFDWELLKMGHDHSLAQGLHPSSELRSSAQGLHPWSEFLLGSSACHAAAVDWALDYDLFQGGGTAVCSPLGYFLAEVSGWASRSASHLETTASLFRVPVQPGPCSAMPCGLAAPLSGDTTAGLLQVSL